MGQMDSYEVITMEINDKKWNEYIKGFFFAVYGGVISGSIVAGYFHYSFSLSIIYVIIIVVLGGLGGYIFYSRIGRIGESESELNPTLLSSSYPKFITKTDAKKLIEILALKEDNAIINFGEFSAFIIAAIAFMASVSALILSMPGGKNLAPYVLVILLIVVICVFIVFYLANKSYERTKHQIENEINCLVNRYNSLKEYSDYVMLKKGSKKCS